MLRHRAVTIGIPSTPVASQRHHPDHAVSERRRVCHRTTHARWAPACARSGPSRACPCTASRRSPTAAGRPSSSARTSAATAPSPSPGSPNSPSSTACRSPSCCPTRAARGAVRPAPKIVIDLERLSRTARPPGRPAGPLRLGDPVAARRLQRQGAVHPRRGPAVTRDHLRHDPGGPHRAAGPLGRAARGLRAELTPRVWYSGVVVRTRLTVCERPPAVPSTGRGRAPSVRRAGGGPAVGRRTRATAARC